jgi:hypothetical protein
VVDADNDIAVPGEIRTVEMVRIIVGSQTRREQSEWAWASRSIQGYV